MMSMRLILSVSFLGVFGLAVGLADAQPLNQDSGPDGIVSVEAEHYDNKTKGISGSEWVQVGPTGTFTGVAGMQVANGTEPQKNTNYAAQSPGLEFQVNFVKTGTHYIWVLAWGPDGGGDTCHAGLDGQEIATCDNLTGWNNNYHWSNARYQRTAAPSFEVTTAGVHTLNIWMREDGLLVDKIVLTTNPNFTLSGTEPGPPESGRGAIAAASNPNPSDGAADMPRDAVLSWTPGASAKKHDVYFGGVLADVEQASATAAAAGVYRGRMDPNFYDVGRLEFSRTYYWRIDEIGAPPGNTIHKGSVWSFTAEPFAYAVGRIIATASSSAAGKGPENTVNGSGLDSTGLLHGNIGEGTMWLSDAAALQPAWILFEFDKVRKLHEMWVWNSNESLEPAVGLGFKNAIVEYSADGVSFTALGTTHEFVQGSGAAGYAHNTTIDMAGVAAKYVRLTANSNWKGLVNQYGLSEVRFFYIPVNAREPFPDSGAADVDPDVTLGWRAGRDAATHSVYLGTDEQAVTDGSAPAVTVTDASYSPLSLELSRTYYWRIDEVNDAGTPTTWRGDVWSFSTPEYLVVDDFESYNNIDPPGPGSNRIFEAWSDGFGIPTNGALVGHDLPPYTEQTIVHGGKQSMPLFYSNTGGTTYSEVKRIFAGPQDWTKYGIQTLALFFHGTPGNTGQLYVKVNGAKVTYPGGSADIARPRWKQWNIDLALLGITLQNVTTLALGIDGNGAAGTLYVDDIVLYRLAPEVAVSSEEIWIEAEATASITAPMQVYDDPTASAGRYISTDESVGDNNSNPPADGIASYTFTVSGGTYKISGRMRTPDASNSFWVRIPGATTPAETELHSSGWVRWNDPPASDNWFWNDVFSDDDDQNATVLFTMNPGTYTLEIARREDGAQLDVLVISKVD